MSQGVLIEKHLRKYRRGKIYLDGKPRRQGVDRGRRCRRSLVFLRRLSCTTSVGKWVTGVKSGVRLPESASTRPATGVAGPIWMSELVMTPGVRVMEKVKGMREAKWQPGIGMTLTCLRTRWRRLAGLGTKARGTARGRIGLRRELYSIPGPDLAKT